MNNNAIKQIYNFNKEAGLLDKPYSDSRECAYPIEEALEMSTNLKIIGSRLNPSTENLETPRAISREIASLAFGNDNQIQPEDVDRLDKHLDIIVFSFGSIFKLGLSPQQAMKALGIVMDCNMAKLSVGTDSEGKQMKPVDFVGPGPKLQRILDERA